MDTLERVNKLKCQAVSLLKAVQKLETDLKEEAQPLPYAVQCDLEDFPPALEDVRFESIDQAYRRVTDHDWRNFTIIDANSKEPVAFVYRGYLWPVKTE